MRGDFPRVKLLKEQLQDGYGYEQSRTQSRERRIVWVGATQDVTGCRSKDCRYCLGRSFIQIW